MAPLAALLHDIGYAFRVLRKRPGFTVAVSLSLALGIGANTAVFNLIDAVMGRMLPVERPEELLLLTHGQGNAFESGFTGSLTIAAATLALVSTAPLAGYLPARWAFRVDPMTALRNE